jgi:hypothetical protein
MKSREKPSPIDEEYVPDESANSIINWSMRIFINLLISSVLIAAIVYVSAQMFIAYDGPADYLAHLIANLYAGICRTRADCSLPYLNAGLVVGMDLLAIVSMVLWSAVSMFGHRDDFGNMHNHLKLISDQIRTDFNGLDAVNHEIARIYKDMAELYASVNVLSDMVKASDERVDMVVEVKRPGDCDADEVAPAA